MVSIDRARLSAKFVIERLRTNVEQLVRQDFPGDHSGPRDLLDLASGLLDTADSYLDASLDALLLDDDKRKLIKEASDVVIGAYAFLDALRGSDMAELPFPIVAPLQRWFEQLKISQNTLFRARIEANYELMPISNKALLRPRNPAPRLSQAVARITWPFLIVTVPAKAYGIVPHLAIVAHEIGHALYRAKGSWDKTALVPDLQAVEKRLQTRLGTQFDSEARDAFSRIFNAWFEELCADAFMHCLTGPAGFFSLTDFAQLLGGDGEFSVTHPSWYQRRKLLHLRLTQSQAGAPSFASVFKKHTGQELTEDFNTPLIKAPSTLTPILGVDNKTSEVIVELYGIMFKAEKLIYEQVTDYLNSKAAVAIYTPAKFDEDLTTHLSGMLAAIPPAETGDTLEDMLPTEFASILNIGWVTLLTKLDKLRVKTPPGAHLLATRALKLEGLHSLLLKAVELSEARTAWMKAT